MHVIEAGMKLFAIKGYHSTSIQEIATESGISKGAFYLYFQSKEDFIATAFQHFYLQIKERIERVKRLSYPPRESLANQINVLIAYIYKYKDFIIMHLRENISIGENTDKLIRRMKIYNYQWIRGNILAIYGDKINNLLADTVIQLDGLIDGYFKWIVMDDIHIEREKIGPFLVRRLDDIVNGMMVQSEEALTTIKQFPQEYAAFMNRNEHEISSVLALLKKKIRGLDLSQTKVKQLQEVVAAIDVETSKTELQPIMIQGLLAHFGHIPEVQTECKQLAHLLHVDLIN